MTLSKMWKNLVTLILDILEQPFTDTYSKTSFTTTLISKRVQNWETVDETLCSIYQLSNSFAASNKKTEAYSM